MRKTSVVGDGTFLTAIERIALIRAAKGGAGWRRRRHHPWRLPETAAARCSPAIAGPTGIARSSTSFCTRPATFKGDNAVIIDLLTSHTRTKLYRVRLRPGVQGIATAPSRPGGNTLRLKDRRHTAIRTVKQSPSIFRVAKVTRQVLHAARGRQLKISKSVFMAPAPRDVWVHRLGLAVRGAPLKRR